MTKPMTDARLEEIERRLQSARDSIPTGTLPAYGDLMALEETCQEINRLREEQAELVRDAMNWKRYYDSLHKEIERAREMLEEVARGWVDNECRFGKEIRTFLAGEK